ncbi:MAG: hypothetical protein EB165_07545, partial [Euryarchaeota archaeon]|nr:hypothetical protein [Euryarchaeota archaeon]
MAGLDNREKRLLGILRESSEPLGVSSLSDKTGWSDQAHVVGAAMGLTERGFASLAEEESVLIGSRNVIKEHVTIHAGSHRATTVGNDCYLMPRSHLGHDCWVGDNVLLSPSAQVAGHVAIGARTVVGMGALIHQFSSIGPVCMIGMGCCVRGDVETCRTVVGEPHKVTGINKVGLARFLGEVDAE